MIAWPWLLVACAVCFGAGMVLAFELTAMRALADDDEAVDEEGWSR